MLGTLRVRKALPNFDAQNRAIRPISRRGCVGSDMPGGGVGWGLVNGGE